MNKDKKARNYIDSACEGKLNGLTLAEFREFQRVYGDLKPWYQNATIMQNVADKFKAFGFKVEQQGIGWVIYG